MITYILVPLQLLHLVGVFFQNMLFRIRCLSCDALFVFRLEKLSKIRNMVDFFFVSYESNMCFQRDYRLTVRLFHFQNDSFESNNIAAVLNCLGRYSRF